MIFAPFAFRNQVVVAAADPSPTPSLTPSISITPSITITPSVTPSITPTPTPTPSAASVITVTWNADMGACATATYSFRKNGSTEASGGGSASSTFTCVVGDVLVAEQTSGIKGIACDGANSAIDRNGVNVVTTSVAGFNATATSTFTVTSGTTSITLYAGLIA